MNTQRGVEMDDEKIIDMYFDRDEQAIELTDRKYGKYLLTIGRNILNNKWESEESLNDTYFATWNKIPPERPGVFQAFLSRLMRNISISRYRKNRADKRIPTEMIVSLGELDECIVGWDSVEDELASTQIASIINDFLEKIDRIERFAFVCRYYYCDSVKSIASMLGVSAKTVYRRLEQMRYELRAMLSREGIE